MTKGAGPSIKSMAAMHIGINWLSHNTTAAPPWSKIYATVSTSSRVLMVFSTAPQAGTPNAASDWAGMLGKIVATTSPDFTPALTNAEARRVTRP